MIEKTKILVVLLLLIGSLASYNYINNYEDGSKFQNQDIVLITIDSLRNDYIDCINSFNRTPNICQLKENSVSFENSYSHASYTTAAMSSVMTGQYPWKLNMLNKTSSELQEESVTLAEKLESKGYENYGFHEVGAAGAEYGYSRGYQNYTSANLFIDFGVYRKYTDNRSHLDLLDKAKNDNELSYVYYHLFGPHQPFRSSESCRNFSIRMRNTPYEGVYDVKKEYRHEFSSKKAKNCYKESVKLSDRRIGNIIDKLKENGQYNDSMIILTADHGEGLWNKGLFGHSRTVDQGLIKVPLIFKFPKQSGQKYQGSRIEDGRARHIDIYPTILDYFDIGFEFDRIDGKSLIPGIQSGRLESRVVKLTSKEARGLIIDNYKFLEFFENYKSYRGEEVEYFEVKGNNSTHIESNQVPDEYINQLSSEITNIGSSTIKDYEEDDHDQELRKRLENLGYLQRDKDSDGAGDSTGENQTSKDNRTIRFTEDGFEPSKIRVETGSKVIWKNNHTNLDMWIASDKHPEHAQYDGSSLKQHCNEKNDDAFDQCETGDKYEFSFGQEGKWRYHNHMNPDYKGKIIVEDQSK